MSEKFGIVYNASQQAVVTDDQAGTQVLPCEFAAVQRSKVTSYIADEGLRWVNPDDIRDGSNPGAVAAKQQYEQLKAAWEEEKTDSPKEASADTKSTNYDDSGSKQASTRSASSKRH